MTRIALMALVSLLAACASQPLPRLRDGQPGLDVARAALSGGTPDIALNISKGILGKEPHNVPALLMQGDALSALGRSDEAEASYANALAARPASVEAKIGLGRLRLRSNPAQAQILFSGVVQQEPRNKLALNDLGIAYDLQSQHATAQGAYRQALSVDPVMRAAEVNLALSLALSGQVSEAIKILRPLASHPEAARRVRQDLAVALTLAGDKQEAARILGSDLTPEQVEDALAAYGALGR
jgi:Flp pilus assembly protein TadD